MQDTQSRETVKSDLKIDREIVMCAIPRGDEELRVVFTEATTGAGKPVAWHSIRLYYQDRQTGEWRPGQKGISIRGKELAGVAAAFAKAVGGARPAAEPKRELLPDEEYRQRRGQVAR